MTKKLVQLFCLGAFFTCLQAEYIVVKIDKDKQQLVALDKLDAENFAKIQQILLDYAWPTNLSNPQRLPNDHPVFKQEEAAEEKFIRELIKKEVGEQYDIIFIPTVMYELFALRESFMTLTQSQKPFDFNALILEKDKEAAWFSLAWWTYGSNLDYSRDLEHYPVQDSIQNQDNTLQDVLGVYRAYAQGVLPGQLSKLLKQGLQQYEIIKDGALERARFVINKSFMHFFIKELKGYSREVLHKDMYSVATGLTAKILVQLVDSFNAFVAINWPNAVKNRNFPERNMFDFGTLIAELNTQKKSLKSDGIIAKTITAEYKARQKNQALLFRGASLVSAGFTSQDKNDIFSMINSISFTLPKNTPETVFDVMKTYFADGLKDYVGSYGNSLFAGSLRDKGAMAYDFIVKAHDDPKRVGYLLFIDKKQYQTNQCDNLFFVAPLGSVVGLFSSGEYFHSRSKIGYTVFEKKSTDIGLCHGLDDTIGFLLINRDPLLQASMLSKFIGEHAFILAMEQPELAEQILKAHKEMAQMYKALALKRATKEVLPKKESSRGNINVPQRKNITSQPAPMRQRVHTQPYQVVIDRNKKAIEKELKNLEFIVQYEKKQISPSELINKLGITKGMLSPEAKEIVLEIVKIKKYMPNQTDLDMSENKLGIAIQTYIDSKQKSLENALQDHIKDKKRFEGPMKKQDGILSKYTLNLQAISDYKNNKIKPSELVTILDVEWDLPDEAEEFLAEIQQAEDLKDKEEQLGLLIKDLVATAKKEVPQRIKEMEQTIELITLFHQPL